MAGPYNVYNGLQPYSVHYIDGIKICIIGMLTPSIPLWLNETVWKGMEFQEMVSCAKKWMKFIKEYERPNLIFGLFHSGMEGGIVDDNGAEENATGCCSP
jgi:5''-nucleotidase/2'',3''-cyclic phosphodiesterase and related esterases